MSSSNFPIERFQHLTINPEMSPTSEEVRARALEIRDVLSSFERDEFPFEYRTEIFMNLDRPLVSRPQQQSEWTIQEDFSGTMLQWASYDDQAYNVIKRIQPTAMLARCFHEKLSRRFDEIFLNYDELAGSGLAPQQALEEVKKLAEDFHTIALAVQDDRRYRAQGQQETARRSLAALVGVCNRNTNIAAVPPSTQRSRRSATASTTSPDNVNFLNVTTNIQREDESGVFLMLEVLGYYPAEIMAPMYSNLQSLSDLLRSHGAPTIYIARADLLAQRAADHIPELSPTTPTSASAGIGVSGAKPSTTAPTVARESSSEVEAEPSSKPGTKRQAAQQGGPKKGRKKPTRGS